MKVTIYQCGRCHGLSEEREYCCGTKMGAFTFPVEEEE